MRASTLIRAVLVLLALAVLGTAIAVADRDRGALHLGMLVESHSGRVIAVESGSAAAARCAALALAASLGAAQPDPSGIWLPAPAVFAAMTAYIWLQRALAAEPGGPGATGALFPLVLSAQALLLVLAVAFGPRLFG